MLTAALLILAPDEATQIPFRGEWINKLPHPYNGVPVSSKKEGTIRTCNVTDESPVR